jgi:hypothetical protein
MSMMEFAYSKYDLIPKRTANAVAVEINQQATIIRLGNLNVVPPAVLNNKYPVHIPTMYGPALLHGLKYNI